VAPLSLSSLHVLMTEPSSVGGWVYHMVGTPIKVFPDSSWAGDPTLETMLSDVSNQYGTHTPPISAGKNSLSTGHPQ